jgi:hypothetical protein
VSIQQGPFGPTTPQIGGLHGSVHGEQTTGLQSGGQGPHGDGQQLTGPQGDGQQAGVGQKTNSQDFGPQLGLDITENLGPKRLSER